MASREYPGLMRHVKEDLRFRQSNNINGYDKDMNIRLNRAGAGTEKKMKLGTSVSGGNSIQILRGDSDSDSESEKQKPSRISLTTPSKKVQFQTTDMLDFANTQKLDTTVTEDPLEEDDSDVSSMESGSAMTDDSDSIVSSVASEMELDNSRLHRKQKKYELLSKLQQLERRGVVLTKKYHIKSKLSDLQFEFERITAVMNKEAGLKFARKVLMAAVTGIEFANRKFDPIQAKLEGWSESVMENINDYDSSLARLVDKYGKSVEVAPEVELFTALVGSGFMFHLSKTIMQDPVGILNSLGQQNPDMLESVMKNVMSSIRPEQIPTSGGATGARSTGIAPPSIPMDDSASESEYSTDSDEDIRLVSVHDKKSKAKK